MTEKEGNKKRVFIFGIDGAPPELIFDKWLDELPNIKKLMNQGAYSRITTSIPPSTAVAWNSFFSGKDASELGVYSYTMRENYEYTSSRLINSRDIRTKMVWDILDEKNKKSIIIGVPVTYPIEKNSKNISMVSGFLTPSFNEKSVYPKEFFNELKELIPDYKFDVNVGLASYKKTGKEELIEKVYKMTKQTLDIVKYCIKNKEWDLLSVVLVGSDRLEHYFWSYIDETHRYFKGETQYRNVIKDYFIYLDKELGKIIELLDEEVTIIVSSDHGMGKMNCRFNLNDWLIKEKYLILNNPQIEPTKLKMSNVNWEKTKAFSVGAYFGRIYFNLKGREPRGVVEKENYLLLQKEISEKLKLIRDDNGNGMDNKIYFPQEIYSGKFFKESPDIMVYFDNLSCGVNNDVGNSGLYSWATTKGSDDAGHMTKGTFILSKKGLEKKEIENLNLKDVTPMILNEFDSSFN